MILETSLQFFIETL